MKGGAVMLLSLFAAPNAPPRGLLSSCLPTACPAAYHAPRQQLVSLAMYKTVVPRASFSRQALSVESAQRPVQSEADVEGMSHFLDSLKWDGNGLVAVVVQVSTPLSQWILQDNSPMPVLTPCMLHAACGYGRHPHASICRQECHQRNTPDKVCFAGSHGRQHVTLSFFSSTGHDKEVPVQARNLLQPVEKGSVVQRRDIWSLHRGHRSLPRL